MVSRTLKQQNAVDLLSLIRSDGSTFTNNTNYLLNYSIFLRYLWFSIIPCQPLLYMPPKAPYHQRREAHY